MDNWFGIPSSQIQNKSRIYNDHPWGWWPICQKGNDNV